MALIMLQEREGLISGVISTAGVKQWKQNIHNNDP